MSSMLARCIASVGLCTLVVCCTADWPLGKIICNSDAECPDGLTCVPSDRVAARGLCDRARVAGIACSPSEARSSCREIDAALTRCVSYPACEECAACAARWSVEFGTVYDDDGSSLAVDAKGNIYTSLYGGQPFWPGSEETSTNVFTLRINADGTHGWMDTIGFNAYETVAAVALGTDDDLYVVGSTDGMLTEPAAGGDVFVARYTDDGETHWLEQLGTPTYDFPRAAAVDHEGNVYITGITDGAFEGERNQGLRDTFLIKLNADREHAWTRQFGTAEDDSGVAIAIERGGGVVVASTTVGRDRDVILHKFDRSGTFIWKQTVSTEGEDVPLAMTIDDDGLLRVVYATSFVNVADAPAKHLLWLQVRDADGELLRDHALATDQVAGETCAFIDARGSVYIAVTTEPLSVADLTGEPAAEQSSIVMRSGTARLMRFDARGSDFVEGKRVELGDVSEAGSPRALTFDAERNLVLMGVAGDRAGEDDRGSNDLFIIKFDRELNRL